MNMQSPLYWVIITKITPRKAGEITIIIKFAAQGSQKTILVYIEYESLLEIKGKGAVLYDTD